MIRELQEPYLIRIEGQMGRLGRIKTEAAYELTQAGNDMTLVSTVSGGARHAGRPPEGAARAARWFDAPESQGPSTPAVRSSRRGTLGKGDPGCRWIDFAAGGPRSFSESPAATALLALPWSRRGDRPRSRAVKSARSKAGTEGEFIDVGATQYQAQLTRILNSGRATRPRLLRGRRRPPQGRGLPADFMKIDNKGDKPYQPPRTMKVVTRRATSTSHSTRPRPAASASTSASRSQVTRARRIRTRRRARAGPRGAAPVPGQAGVGGRQPAAGARDPRAGAEEPLADRADI